MPQNANNADELQGLSGEEVMKRQTQFGKNVFQYKKPSRFLLIIREFLQEPMFVLLMVACALYFILGQTDEGWMMLVAMLIVAAISVYQEVKSSKALRALKELTDPKVWVIRNGKEKWLDVTELVPSDVIVLEEGVKVPADATIIRSNDLTVNESVLTGESLPVDKSAQEGHSLLYQGTLINTGKCYAVVTATGNQTALGKIGKAVSTATQNKSG